MTGKRKRRGAKKRQVNENIAVNEMGGQKHGVLCSFLTFGGVRKKKGLVAVWYGEGVSLTQYEVLVRVSSISYPHTEARLYLSKLLVPLLHMLLVLYYSKLPFCPLYHSKFMYYFLTYSIVWNSGEFRSCKLFFYLFIFKIYSISK